MADRPILLACSSISRQIGARTLFADLSLTLAEGDRVGLIGPNGSGKTTLLSVLAGLEEPDRGQRTVRRGVRIGYVPQDPSFPAGASVSAILAAAVHDLPLAPHEQAQRVAEGLSRAGFADPEQGADALSGGWRKRLAIVRERICEPDLLLLDEPTNHLDLEGILWLEEWLATGLGARRAAVVVSHDRYFLENVAGRMVEISRIYPDGLFAVDGTYSDFLERRDALLQNQAEYLDTLANRARREVEWLRRGPKARTTKAKARVDAASRLLAELAEVRARRVEPPAGIDFTASQRKSRKLLVARGLGKSFAGRPVLAGIDLAIAPGTRLGVLGPNGSGKSTLLALLAGTLAPDAGSIERAASLQTVLFEQGRESLDRGVSLRRALAPDSDSVIYRGQPVHVAAWASRFLFRAEQLDTPVSRLSGGEQARILIARLMLRPADLLILDEPTNDLDIATLEVLEESLLDFPGGLVLVTHDRYLLDRVATSILALDGRGGGEPFADTAQWQAAQRERPAARDAAARAPVPVPAGRASAAPAKRLGYLLQREWEGMEGAILAAEEALAATQAAAEDPAIATDAAALGARYAALAAARAEVERLYARWAELEAMVK